MRKFLQYLPTKPSNILAPTNPFEFLGFVLFSFMLALVTGGKAVGVALGLSFILLVFAVWCFYDVQRRKRTVISVSRGQPEAAKGLILPLSPYNPRSAELSDKELLQKRVDGVLDRIDLSKSMFDEINLLGSNLAPQIEAIDYHASRGKLRDVWLLCTTSEQNPTGSKTSAAILKRYIQLLYGTQRFDVHQGDQWTVHEQDYGALWKMAEYIFRTSGYQDDVIVADVTGGTKMMSIAIAMACISPRRRMQYMDGQRNWQGEVLEKGEMTPVLINFDPILYQETQKKALSNQ